MKPTRTQKTGRGAVSACRARHGRDLTRWVNQDGPQSPRKKIVLNVLLFNPSEGKHIILNPNKGEIYHLKPKQGTNTQDVPRAYLVKMVAALLLLGAALTGELRRLFLTAAVLAMVRKIT